jgi:hypothetical protein
MNDQPESKPSIDDIVARGYVALDAGEMTLPDTTPDLGLQAAAVEDRAIPGFNVASDPEAGLRFLFPTYQVCRGTVEYESHYAEFREQIQATAEDGLDTSAAAELLLEDIVHAFLHDAYDADAADELDAFIQRSLAPQLVQIWALMDAYSQLVLGKLPEGGDKPLTITSKALADIDPYGDDGRALALQLWDYMESEMHPKSVHALHEVQMARQLKPVSKKARKHAEHPKKR